MNIQTIVSKYNVRVLSDGKHIIADREIRNSPNDQKYLIEHKHEIIEYINHRHDEYTKKVMGIDGLEELRKCYAAWDAYYSDCGRWVANKGCSNPPKKPDVTVDELEERYPWAKTYLEAVTYSFSRNETMSSIGEKAVKRILEGEDQDTVIEEMKDEWARYCDDHVWLQ